MSEYINKNDVLARIECKSRSLDASVNHYYREGVSDIYGLVSEIPAEEVAEVRHGYWKKDYEYEDLGLCSICNSTGAKEDNYCSECGAKMDGEE